MKFMKGTATSPSRIDEKMKMFMELVEADENLGRFRSKVTSAMRGEHTVQSVLSAPQPKDPKCSPGTRGKNESEEDYQQRKDPLTSDCKEDRKTHNCNKSKPDDCVETIAAELWHCASKNIQDDVEKAKPNDSSC